MHLLNKNDLKKVEGGHARTPWDDPNFPGFEKVVPKFQPPIVENHTWQDHPFFAAGDRYVPPWLK